jgi:hypothetical protein
MKIFESLLAGLRTVCADFPDARRSPESGVGLLDGGYRPFSVFLVFYVKRVLFVFPTAVGEWAWTSNCHSLFGMKKIPTDNYIRLMLDPVSPEALQLCFDQVILYLTPDACGQGKSDKAHF